MRQVEKYVHRTMPSFDSDYANERIDCIMKTSKTWMDLYMQLKATTPSDEDMHTLMNLHTSMHSDISNYYTYLEEVGISPEDSYLTHWLDAGYFYDYAEEIECFLVIARST